MSNRQRNHRSTRPRVAGMATLEFALALPVLLLLIVGIVWVGKFVIGQTEVIVEARNKAWKRRFEDVGKKPLMFPTGFGDIKNPEYPGTKDYVVEEATTKVEGSPIYKALPSPKSSHVILAGSWDQRAMPLEAPPHWELVTYAVANAKTGKLQNAASMVDNIDQLLQDAVAKALAEAASKVAGAGGSAGGGGIEDIASAPESKPEEGKRGQTEEDERTKRLQAEREQVRQELDQVNKDLEKLGQVKPKEPKETTQERQLLIIKQQRLENQLSFLNKEIG